MSIKEKLFNYAERLESDQMARHRLYAVAGLVADVPFAAVAAYRAFTEQSAPLEQLWQVIGIIGVPAAVGLAGIAADDLVKDKISSWLNTNGR